MQYVPENGGFPVQSYQPPPTTVLVIYQPVCVVYSPSSACYPPHSMQLPPPQQRRVIVEEVNEPEDEDVPGTSFGDALEESNVVWRPRRGVNSSALVIACVLVVCILGLIVSALVTVFAAQAVHKAAVVSTVHTPHVPPVVPKQPSASVLSAASKALVRINQVDPAQYASMQEYNLWWPSTCSAASMTEIINAYGHHYRLTDILKVETGLGEITPDAGLLDPHGLDTTLARFNFTTHWLYDPLALPAHPSVDTLIATANSGTPVIINFPPSRWAGGHLLVAVGGNKNYVYLADSSRINMHAMDRKTFLKYWIGFAVVATPAYSVLGAPTLAANALTSILRANGSPASDKGQVLYDLGVKYGIDPAFALAFFQHESSFGKAGEASSTHSLGNLRCIPNVACVNTSNQPCQAGQSCYAAFSTWDAGFEAWYRLIRTLYVSTWHLTTIDQIIPVYAPPGDNNNDNAYIASLKHALDAWHAGNLTA